MTRFEVSVPATSANLGPGFDVLGLALTMYNRAEVFPSQGTGVHVIESLRGEGAGVLPQDEHNLFVQSMQLYADAIGLPLPSCRLRLTNEVPLARGLGSSAATIVGGLAAAAVLLGRSIDRAEILRIAAEQEGHADNVAAAVYGGLTIAYQEDVDQTSSFAAHGLRPAPGLAALLVIPTDELSTARARSALDAMVPRGDAVYNIGRSSLLVAVLMSGDFHLLPQAVKDRLHQSQRLPLLPFFEKTRQLLAACDINAIALSGAGPTIISLISFDICEEASSRVSAMASEQGLPARVTWCNLSEHGLVVTNKG